MLTMGMFSKFDKLLDKVTSNRTDTDWSGILQISDLIRQGDTTPKYVINAIKKKMSISESTYQALIVLESVVKNCGHKIHDEVATKVFMEYLRDFLKTTTQEPIKQKILEMIQAWASAFQTTPKYKAVADMLVTLKAEGHKFPVLKESDAMFSADSAPEWLDASSCYRCKVVFSILQRKHHCRACGNVVCGDCSNKNSTLPQFGIEKEVRVCEFCFDKNSKNRAASPSDKVETEILPPEYLGSSLAQQTQAPKPGKSEAELKEEEELQLAIALSQSEAEAKEKEKKRATAEIISNSQKEKTASNVQQKVEEETDDPELARYLNRSYWEQRQGQPDKNYNNDKFRNSPPSAPETPTHQMETSLSEAQLAEFVHMVKAQVEIFVNRMKSNSSRGRSISNDSSVQNLFMSVTDYHSRLLQYIHQKDDMRVYYEGLQDKLTQVKDAMAALEALREEHQEKLRREAAEAERQKQIQMNYKLQIMRKKKQEYLQQQRQAAFQRVQDEERVMQLRKEHQIQQSLMGNMAPYMMPYQQPGYPPQGPAYGPAPGYLPPGYPPMHQGTPQMPNPQMMPGQLPPQGLPHPAQMVPHMQHPPQSGMPPQHPPQSGMAPQHPPQSGMAPQHPPHPGMPHQMHQTPMGPMPPGMHGPPGMAPQGVPPGVPPGQLPHGHPHMHGVPPSPLYQGVIPGHPQIGPMPNMGQMQSQVMSPGTPQQQPMGPNAPEHSTAELIRFD